MAAKAGEAHSIARDSANSGRMAMGVSSYCSAASHFAPDKSGAQFRLLYEGDLVPA
jgi:dihydrodipicolinate synthase/N-acetylneuraminate lyase